MMPSAPTIELGPLHQNKQQGIPTISNAPSLLFASSWVFGELLPCLTHMYYPHGPLNETTWHISCWLCCVFNFHKIKIYASNSKILNFWPLGHSYCSIVAGYLTCNKMTSFLPSSKVCTWQSTYRPRECRIPQLSGTLLAPPFHFPIITHNFY